MVAHEVRPDQHLGPQIVDHISLDWKVAVDLFTVYLSWDVEVKFNLNIYGYFKGNPF